MDGDEEGNAELLALHRIDETSTRLQQQGNYLEALECMERGLVLRQHFFGPSSDEVWSACKTVGEMCNLLAMTYLQQEDFSMALELLKKAEILTERDDRGRAVTFNNLACYYRKQGKLRTALQYLQNALKLEQVLPNVDNRADTHLNLCAVLSQLGRHSGALEHAQSALILLQEELFPGPLSPGQNEKEKKTASVDRIAVLAIAYHNTGVELEFLKRYESALENYNKGVQIAQAHLGEDHGITQTLQTSHLAAKKTLESKLHRKQTSSGLYKKKTAIRKKPGRSKSPNHAQQDQRWNNIQQAYGDIATEFRPKPVVSNQYNLQATVAPTVNATKPSSKTLDIPRVDTQANPRIDSKQLDAPNTQSKQDKQTEPVKQEQQVAKQATPLELKETVDKEKITSLITPRDESALDAFEQAEEVEEREQANDEQENSPSDQESEESKEYKSEESKQDIQESQANDDKEEEQEESEQQYPDKAEMEGKDSREDSIQVIEKDEYQQVKEDKAPSPRESEGKQQDPQEGKVDVEEKTVDYKQTQDQDQDQEEVQDEQDGEDNQQDDEEDDEQDNEQDDEEEEEEEEEEENTFEIMLPKGWTKAFSRSKKKEYFFNTETGDSVWSYDEVEKYEENRNNEDDTSDAGRQNGEEEEEEEEEETEDEGEEKETEPGEQLAEEYEEAKEEAKVEKD